MKAGIFARKYLLNQKSKTKEGNRLSFNFTYHPSYKLKNILSNINLLLTSEEEHRQIFFEVSIMDFKRVKSLKDLLVRTKVSLEKETDGKSCENLVVRGNAAKIALFRTENLFH